MLASGVNPNLFLGGGNFYRADSHIQIKRYFVSVFFTGGTITPLLPDSLAELTGEFPHLWFARRKS